MVPALEQTALKSFVLDLVNIPTEQGQFEIHVVELNPFFEATGGCLFDWNLDKPVLMGIEPFEFRYNKSVLQSFNMNYLEDDLRSFVEEIV